MKHEYVKEQDSMWACTTPLSAQPNTVVLQAEATEKKE